MDINKCKGCIWSNKISASLLFCIFPKCIIKEECKEKVMKVKKLSVVSKSKTSCKGRMARRVRNASKKTKKAFVDFKAFLN
ncbi:hypothetical protein [Clostridium sp. C8-1-8]|uniref:hypothetical protein n=1 Tax=Clostridium sp. C8-1-8 TaxID=2698831 RepID=UPI001371C4DD|nr:hypothetical protein [Clostridium sp. C8-1-8]